MTRDNSNSVVIERPRNRGSIPGRDERYLFVALGLAVQSHPASSSLDTEGRVKRPGREADLHLTPRFKNEWKYTSIPPYACAGIAYLHFVGESFLGSVAVSALNRTL